MFHTHQRFLTAFLATMFTPAFGGVIFSDATFNLGNYTQTPTFQSNGTIAVSQCASCGNPGQALQFVENFTADPNPGTVAAGLANTTFSYNPLTQGAIARITASVDKTFLLSTSLGSIGNSFRPMIVQDGNYYLAAIAGPNFSGTSSGLLTLSGTLQQDDFVQFSFATATFGTAHPNFAGNPILLGLTQLSGSIGGRLVESTQYYDNLSFEISTPEPASFAVFLLLTPPFVMALRRRRR